MGNLTDILNDYMCQTPDEYYRELAQATFDDRWDNTTQIYTIYEENYPFDDTYTEYEAHVNSVSEFIVNTTKLTGDYIRIMFKDIEHTYNHRGQKYKVALDGENENVYLCYDKLNPINLTPDFKCIKCNNVLTFLRDGEIIKEPCSIGYEITSTNNNITKDGTIEQRRLVCLVQINDNTKYFVPNQRFLLTPRDGFKITQMFNMNKENTYDTDGSMMTLYVEWSEVTANDNKDLLIADYYNYDYTIDINSADLSLINGATGQLTATVKLNGVEQTDMDVSWSTSDSNVIKIDSEGNYQVIGSSDSTAQITASTDIVSDTIDVTIVESATDSKEIIINPTSDRITIGATKNISYGVYNNNTLTTDIVTITPSGADSNCYELTYGTNIVTVKNLKQTTKRLILTFSSVGLDDKVCTITLGGIM